jgi:hypothetical protein
MLLGVIADDFTSASADHAGHFCLGFLDPTRVSKLRRRSAS